MLEQAGYMMNVDENEIIDCALDNDEYIELLKKFSEMNGAKGVIIQYQLDDPPELSTYNEIILNFQFFTILFL